jgi:hypothetical protein
VRRVHQVFEYAWNQDRLADWARSPHPQGATGWERVGWG